MSLVLLMVLFAAVAFFAAPLLAILFGVWVADLDQKLPGGAVWRVAGATVGLVIYIGLLVLAFTGLIGALAEALRQV